MFSSIKGVGKSRYGLNEDVDLQNELNKRNKSLHTNTPNKY